MGVWGSNGPLKFVRLGGVPWTSPLSNKWRWAWTYRQGQGQLQGTEKVWRWRLSWPACWPARPDRGTPSLTVSYILWLLMVLLLLLLLLLLCLTVSSPLGSLITTGECRAVAGRGEAGRYRLGSSQQNSSQLNYFGCSLQQSVSTALYRSYTNYWK